MTAGSRDVFDFFDPARTATTRPARDGRHSLGRHARDDHARDDRASLYARAVEDVTGDGAVGSVSGTLPPLPAQADSPAETTASIPVVPTPPQSPPQPAVPAQEGTRPRQRPARRQRVALSETQSPVAATPAHHTAAAIPSSPAPEPEPAGNSGDGMDDADDNERIRPVDGLGTFDLGSVPASVTPPSTWRRAAWFASLSSGAVVVAMLVAGTLLVGPDEQSAAVDGWPDRNGAVAPLLPDDRGGNQQQPAPPATSSTSETSRATETRSDEQRSTASAAPVREDMPGQPAQPTASAPSDTNAPGSGTPSGSAPPSTSLTKPPPTPAPTSTASPVYFRDAHDTETMAQRSQSFFDQVTEDPQAAHELTSGELRNQGAEGLERAYADIAYFEVEHIAIDQYEGVTDNTLRVTYEDGSTVEQTRRLTFDDAEKISSDGA